MPLRTNVIPGDANHDTLHNEERVRINALDLAVPNKLDVSAAAELIRDTIGTALVAGTNVTIDVNDTADTITINSTGSGGSGTTTGSSFGYVFAEEKNVNGALLSDRANWTTSLPDNSTTWPVLLQYAHDNGLKIWLRPDRAYDMKGLSALDINVRIVGGGTLVVRPNVKSDGYFGTIRHQPAAANFGIAVTSYADALLANVSGTPSRSEYNTQITLTSSANLSKFAHGDVWKITANVRYSWDNQSGAQGNVWKGEHLDVIGVLFPVTSSTILEGDVIVGATSGATGTVGSVVSGSIILKSHTGTFTASESLTVGGTAKGTMNGAGKVLVRGRLKDSYSAGTMTLGKLRSDLHVELDIVLDTLTDPEITIADTTKRNNAFTLWGCVEPRGTVRVRNSYATSLFMGSVHRNQIELHVRKSVNNAAEAPNAAADEGAYGYGYECVGSTTGGNFRGTGERMRHWFTTNPLVRTSYPTSNDVYWHFIGAVRGCDVSANIWSSWAAALDNHIGAYDLYYHDSTIDTTGVAAGRIYAGREALQNRSCNTTYERVKVIGPVSNGINDLSVNKDWGQSSKTRMIDCHFDNILINCYAIESTPLAANSIFVLRTFFGMTTLTSTALGEGSIGIDIPAANAVFKDVIVKNANYAAVNITTGLNPATVVIDNLRFDQSESPATSAYMIRVAAAGLTLDVNDLVVYENGTTWAATNRAAIHVASGSPTIRRTARPVSLGGSSAILPVLTSGSAASTLSIKDGYDTSGSSAVSNMVFYNTSTNTWPARPATTDPVIAISTKSPSAPRPTWMTAGQYDGDIWMPDPDSVSA